MEEKKRTEIRINGECAAGATEYVTSLWGDKAFSNLVSYFRFKHNSFSRKTRVNSIDESIIWVESFMRKELISKFSINT